MTNEINKTSSALSTSLNQITATEPLLYELANVYRVLFARIFDILISAIPGFVCAAVLKDHVVGNWVGATVNLSIGLGVIIFYFMVLPYFLGGNTLGKLIFGIRLKHKGTKPKVKFYMLAARETFFMLIPWVVALIFFIIALVVMDQSHPDDPDQKGTSNTGAYIIYQLGYLFYFLWFFFLCITIKVQPEHQAGIDLKFNLFVVYKEPLNRPQASHHQSLKRSDDHISLTEQPGNFDSTMMEGLDPSKWTTNKTISLADLDVKPDKPIDLNKTPSAELEHHDQEDE